MMSRKTRTHIVTTGGEDSGGPAVTERKSLVPGTGTSQTTRVESRNHLASYRYTVYHHGVERS